MRGNLGNNFTGNFIFKIYFKRGEINSYLRFLADVYVYECLTVQTIVQYKMHVFKFYSLVDY